MQYRTRLDMTAVQREVQFHLQQLRDQGYRIPSDPNPDADIWQPSTATKELQPGFSEVPTKPISKDGNS
jgi:hypothetical protein